MISSCTKTSQTDSNERIAPINVPTIEATNVSALNPEEVVALYFQSWKSKKYDVMYSLISEGFKNIEPTAKSFEDFKMYMDSYYQTASSIEIVYAKSTYQNKNEAGVQYKIEVTQKDGTKKLFSSSYTLKKKELNASGWKLIHPYGENIDTS